ncbi:hypothetical protein ACIBO1_29040 [Micromonospora sp. NPDC049903]|uniref:hypothetical protein n=1 Tax=Micromonospora sp. NPDC049903 TaxID=3364276 RepID=UPI0037B1A5EF
MGVRDLLRRWRGPVHSDAVGPTPVADPAPTPVVDGRGWRSVPPMDRLLAGIEVPISDPIGFRHRLATWQDPTARRPLHHLVSPDAPSGLAHDLLRPVPPAKPARATGTALPGQRPAASTLPVQRRATAGSPAEPGPPAPALPAVLRAPSGSPAGPPAGADGPPADGPARTPATAVVPRPVRPAPARRAGTPLTLAPVAAPPRRVPARQPGPTDLPRTPLTAARSGPDPTGSAAPAPGTAVHTAAPTSPASVPGTSSGRDRSSTTPARHDPLPAVQAGSAPVPTAPSRRDPSTTAPTGSASMSAAPTGSASAPVTPTGSSPAPTAPPRRDPPPAAPTGTTGSVPVARAPRVGGTPPRLGLGEPIVMPAPDPDAPPAVLSARRPAPDQPLPRSAGRGTGAASSGVGGGTPSPVQRSGVVGGGSPGGAAAASPGGGGTSPVHRSGGPAGPQSPAAAPADRAVTGRPESGRAVRPPGAGASRSEAGAGPSGPGRSPLREVPAGRSGPPVPPPGPQVGLGAPLVPDAAPPRIAARPVATPGPVPPRQTTDGPSPHSGGTAHRPAPPTVPPAADALPSASTARVRPHGTSPAAPIPADAPTRGTLPARTDRHGRPGASSTLQTAPARPGSPAPTAGTGSASPGRTGSPTSTPRAGADSATPAPATRTAHPTSAPLAGTAPLARAAGATPASPPRTGSTPPVPPTSNGGAPSDAARSGLPQRAARLLPYPAEPTAPAAAERPHPGATPVVAQTPVVRAHSPVAAPTTAAGAGPAPTRPGAAAGASGPAGPAHRPTGRAPLLGERPLTPVLQRSGGLGAPPRGGTDPRTPAGARASAASTAVPVRWVRSSGGASETTTSRTPASTRKAHTMAGPQAPVAGSGARTTPAPGPHPARSPARPVAGPIRPASTVPASVPPLAGPVPRPAVVTRAPSTPTGAAPQIQRTPRGHTVRPTPTPPRSTTVVQRTGPEAAGAATATRAPTPGGSDRVTAGSTGAQTVRDGGREDRDSAERFHHLDRRALDELAHRLVEPISRLLRTELRRGRERSGRWLDGGR